MLDPMTKHLGLVFVLVAELLIALTLGRPVIADKEAYLASQAYKKDPSEENRARLVAAGRQVKMAELLGSFAVFVVLAIPTIAVDRFIAWRQRRSDIPESNHAASSDRTTPDP